MGKLTVSEGQIFFPHSADRREGNRHIAGVIRMGLRVSDALTGASDGCCGDMDTLKGITQHPHLLALFLIFK